MVREYADRFWLEAADGRITFIRGAPGAAEPSPMADHLAPRRPRPPHRPRRRTPSGSAATRAAVNNNIAT
jgi:hypothetical protein